MKVCTEIGCGKPHRARGLCASHYNQTHQKERHVKQETRCAWCGTAVMKGKSQGTKRRATCSTQCREYLRRPYCPLPADHWARWYGKTSEYPRVYLTAGGPMDIKQYHDTLRSPLAQALLSGDAVKILEAIKHDCAVTIGGCWEWQRKITKEGYPLVKVSTNGRRVSHLVHRLSIEAKHGKSLGTQASHHMCANTKCVNPAHLQPVTHRENTAEMLQRNYFIQRISDLERALQAVAPNHPALQEISIRISA